MPTFDNVLVTGNQLIQTDLQVNGNETVQTNLQVNGSQTVLGNLQVNGSQSVTSNLGVGSEFSAGGSVSAGFRLISTTQAGAPVVAPTIREVRYFATSVVNQPGLVLKGTDGNDYVLFIDTTGGTVNIGIQKI